MNFLFWNLQKNNSFFDVIREMVRENSIGVAMFAEFPNGNQERLLSELKKVYPSFRYLRSVVPAKVEVFTTLPAGELITIRDEHRFTVKRYISRTLNRTFNLVLCHLISKTNDSKAESNQAEEARYVVQAISEMEKAEGNCLTIVCGDLNMNPFEEGMVGSSCFNAVMDKTIAMNLRRTVNEREFKMFYNPMWGLFGDNGRSIVSGTHFYRISVGIEPLQFVFRKGFSEIDDVMHNTLGCLIGYGMYKAISLLASEVRLRSQVLK